MQSFIKNNMVTLLYKCEIWLSAVYILGKDNETADYVSSLQNESTEWKLSQIILRKMLKVFYWIPEIDLFASYINYQIDQYALWHPDRSATAIYVLSISWFELNFNAFPPIQSNRSSYSKSQLDSFRFPWC